MGALLNQLPTPKKQPAKATRPAKLNQYSRDPQWPSERLRASSDYDTEKGYSPFFHGFLADLPRLSSGNSCTLLLLTLWAKSAGRGAAKGQPRPEWTLALSVEDLAQICRCDVRTIERELAAMDKRGLAEIRRPGKGEIEARLKYRDWESLPDYKSAVVKMDEPDIDVAVDPEKVDETKPGNQRVTGKKPVRLAAGAVSKVFPVSCGVRSFRHKSEGVVDLEFSCVIQAGELLVVSKVPDDLAEKLAKSEARSNGINENTSFPRHGCREESGAIPTNAGKVNPSKRTVDHPRAAELIDLFDPLLKKSQARLLSEDSAALLAACEAYRSLPKENLLHFLMTGKSPRAARPISSPKHVAAIVQEAVGNWIKLGGVSDIQLPRDAKKQGFVDGVMADVARRLKRDGKV